MKRLFLMFLSFLLTLPLVLSCLPFTANAENGWTVRAVESRIKMPEYRLSSEKAVEEARNSVYESYKNSIAGRKAELTSGKITIDGWTMELYVKKIGLPGPKGYPVYIALHGGGNDNKEWQREQYRIMQSFYDGEIETGLYIVPLAIVAAGDEHYQPESFLFYDRIIEDAIAFHQADPNRIYLTGFSSGGDGVYAIAPMMPERFAAVEMCAGSSSCWRFENLCNLPFRIQMGEKDSAYERNSNAAKVDGILKDLASRYGGFQHQTLIHVGGDHNSWTHYVFTKEPASVYTGKEVQNWFEGKNAASTSRDARSVHWLSQYRRDPLPKKVVWSTAVCAGLRRTKGIYWLDRDGLLQNATVVASYDRATNSVTIEQCDATQGTLKVFLNSSMLNLFKPVSVTVAGVTIRVDPVCSRQIMESTLKMRGDPELVFSAEIDIHYDAEQKLIEVEPVYKYEADYDISDPDRLLYWDSQRIFHVDQSLFGLTREQLSSRLNLALGELEPWPYYGTDVYWTYVSRPDKPSVIFMFQYNKCVMIYSEMTGKPSRRLEQAAEEQYGNFLGVLACEGRARYYLEDHEYDGRHHTVQQYQYFSFWFQR